MTLKKPMPYRNIIAMPLASFLLFACTSTSNIATERNTPEVISIPGTIKESTHEKEIRSNKVVNITTPMPIQASEKATKVSPTHNLPGNWDLSGAIAARGNNKSWTASINWLQKGRQSYQIRLSGPLGGGSILIYKKGNTVYFRDGAKADTSGNASALLKKHTGIGLPVHNLYYWVRGIAAPGAVQSVKKDQAGHIISLRQSGFVINYTGYSNANMASLPTRITLQGQNVFIKLVIKRWNF